ncbi:5-oxoprolinase subunit B family protein [Sporosarcina psychrophila]|uniref:5-oxoprolinase subunit B family protein n=1 Tax=Sporosarcina psychrophila TaxID=1476 RepID=UPI00078DFE7A|nr:carboxyltransferase domain-containing protein [Sporosarcina psychrophila]AMQ07841.1 allophanate hydrolase [Sporosarcina psychrophila]
MGNSKTRYSFGGDEFLLVELSEEMSLEVNFKVRAITNEVKSNKITGIQDVCSANASYMIRFNPDVIEGTELIEKLKVVEESLGDFRKVQINSRLVEIPIYFDDPWTKETAMKFRDRHQDPNCTDIEYVAKINGFDSIKSFIHAMTNSPFLVTMIGFAPGLPFCTQIVPQEKQIEAPKYIRPRTYTPERCFAIGGTSVTIYPSEGTGGAQMLGITPVPVFDKKQELYDFKETMVFPRQGDIFKFRSICRDEYETVREEVNNGTFQYLKKDFTFTPNQILNDLEGFSETAVWRLYND